MLNKVQIIGHLGRDPESRSFQNGGKVVNLRVATSETWKDRNTGEKRERTEWHTVAIFADHAANFADRFLRKGSKVYIEGKLETRKWQDQSGQDRYSTEIVIRPYQGDIKSLEKLQSDGNGSGGQSGGGSGGGNGYNGYQDDRDRNGGGYGGGGGGDMDDEVPFAPEWRA